MNAKDMENGERKNMGNWKIGRMEAWKADEVKGGNGKTGEDGGEGRCAA
jgi:hypothetical protein